MNDEGWRTAYNDENYVVVNHARGDGSAWFIVPIFLVLFLVPFIMDAVRLFF